MIEQATVECPVCKRAWVKGCQQETIIGRHGTCAVCRYDEKSPEGMSFDQMQAEMTEMFGPGEYVPGVVKRPYLNSRLWEKKGTPNLKALASVAAIGAMCGIPIWSKAKGKVTREMRKCGLPGCEVMTDHPGGYCKADHCREHQRMQRDARIQARTRQ